LVVDEAAYRLPVGHRRLEPRSVGGGARRRLSARRPAPVGACRVRRAARRGAGRPPSGPERGDTRLRKSARIAFRRASDRGVGSAVTDS